MKITDIRTRNICIPLSTLGKHEPVTMWYGSRFAAIKTIIFIETDEGITGLGETSIGAGGDQRLFEQIKSRLVGRDPHDINSIERGMNLTGQVTTKLGHLLDTSASSALNITGSIDQALWDIVGKAANEPIYNLIGGKYRDRVEARYWMGAKPPDKVADEVKRAVALGFKSFKIKIGLNPEFDVECVAAAREAAGPRIELGYDCNGSYSQLEAIRMLRKMEQFDPSHVEEPVDSSSVRALAEVSRHTDIPILCDGPARTTKEQILELIIQRACDAIHLDVVINGGFLETQRCAAIAEAGGLKVSCHSSPGETGIATAAQLHLVTATPNFIWPVDSAYTKLLPPSEDIITEPFTYDDGALTPPSGPGLGVEIDEDAISRAEERYANELPKWRHRFAPDPTVPSRQQYYFFNYPSKHQHDDAAWRGMFE